MAVPDAAQADDLYWDANGSDVGSGGDGDWDANGALWSESSNDVLGPYRTWDNSVFNSAIFQGSPGLVTVTSPITVNDMHFTTSGYTLTGGQLTLGGTDPIISVASGMATIESHLSGSSGFIKTGDGTLRLTGDNTFSGDLELQSGWLRIDDDGALGDISNTIHVSGDSGLRIDSGDASSRIVDISESATLTLTRPDTGSAVFTGAGSVNLESSVQMTNDSNTYTGQTIFNGANQGSGAIYFSSVRNLGEASSLGAPTTVENGTIRFVRGTQYTDRIVYTGDGDSSNRSWEFSGGSTRRLFLNQGTGALELTGDVELLQETGFETGDFGFSLLGVISGDADAVYFQASETGSISLSGVNTYSGITHIGGGAVTASVLADAGTASSFGTASLIRLDDQADLTYTGVGHASNRTWESAGDTSIRNHGSGALNLNGDLEFTTAGVSDSLTFGGTYTGTNTISGIISGEGDLRSAGAGVWYLTGSNTRYGSILMEGGTLRAGDASAFGSVTGLTVNGGVLDLNGFDLGTASLNGSGGAIDLGSGTLTISNGDANSFSGVINGTGGLTKSGAGILTLSGANNYSGDTMIGGGALNLDFSAASAPTTNIISSSSSLDLAGGLLDLIGADGKANTQVFNGLDISAGNNRIVATSGVGGSISIDFGTITRSGGLMNFGLPANGAFTTTNSDGALGGWATVNGSDYAKVVGGVIIAFEDADYTDKDEASTWADGEYISDDDGDADGFSGNVTGSVQLAGLRYTHAAGTTISISASETLGVDGAIIVAPSVGSNNQSITGGSLTGGAGGGTLGVLQNSDGNFTIASDIIDNGGASGFTKGGAGRVTLSGDNTYTGVTTLSGGTLRVTTIGDGGVSSNIGASSAASSNLVLESGTLEYNGVTAVTDRGFTLVNGGAAAPTIHVTGPSNLTFAGLVTSPDDAGLTKTGAGTLTLANGNNDYVGATTITGGMLSIDSIADGGLVSGIGASSRDAENLVMLGGGMLQYTGVTASSDRNFTVEAGGGGFDVTDSGAVLTMNGVAEGVGSITKNGDGTLVLSGNNTYTGATFVNGGILRAGSSQAFGPVLGSGAVPLTVNAGGQLDLDGFDNTIGPLKGDGLITLGTGTLNIRGATGVFTGTISGDGGLLRTGLGIQTITGCNNDYSGPTTITSSTLSIDCLADGGVASGIGASASDSSNLVLDRGRLTYTGTNVSTDRGMTLQAGQNYIDVSQATTTLEVSGDLNGSADLRKEGDGELLLSGNNSFGRTYVQSGTLRAGSTTAFGTSFLQLRDLAGATLDLDGFDNTFIYINGGGGLGGDIALGDATLTISAGANSAEYAGTISGSGGLVKNGASNQLQTLTGCNSSYSGSTVINGGILAVSCLQDGGANSTIGASSADASNLVLDGGMLRYLGAGNSTDRTFTLGASLTSSLEASGSGAVNFTNTSAIAFSSPASDQRLTLAGTNTDDNRLAALISNNGAGETSLSKTGTGTWILTNSNSTYTGVTTIIGGVLGVDKLAHGGLASSIGMSSADSSNLVIGSGGTLRYTGTGDATDRGFTLAAGTTAIQSSGSGAIEFTNANAIAYSGVGSRVVSLGGTNTGDNILSAGIGDQDSSNVTSLAKNDGGRWLLTGDTTYTGSTNINAGTLFLGNGGISGSIESQTVNNFGRLGFDRSDTLAYGGLIQGSGDVQQMGAGITVLAGDNTYSGSTDVLAGTLRVNGDQSAATGLTRVTSGATLGGSGIIGGDIVIENGGILAPGNSPGGLTVNGNLLLDSASVLDFEFGEANSVGGPLNDLTEVGGNLTLDGVINVTVSAGGNFDAGLYRIINYAGSLTDNTLDIGTMPPGSDVFVQTSITNQVNLVNTAGLDINLWDGADHKFDETVNGGDGVWQNGGGNDNWTDVDGVVNLPWQDDAFAIFTADAGTVTVDESLGSVTASGMQFASDGYRVTGDSIGLAGSQSILRVGDGTLAGLGMAATIDSRLMGATEVVKTDLGTLILGGANTYTGGTRIEAGVLSVSENDNLGDAAGSISFDGGVLQTTATFASGRSVALDDDGSILTDTGTTLTLSGVVSGGGAFQKDGAGSLVLTTDNTYTGATTISAGALQLGDGGTSGSILGDVVSDGTIAFNRSDVLEFIGAISGTGALSQLGVGTTMLTADNTYTGGTTIESGVLQLGDGGTSGSILGDVVNDGTIALNRSDLLTFDGFISGTGTLSQKGEGETVLTADNSYDGATDIKAGALIIDGNQSMATGLTSVASGAALGGSGVIGGDAIVADDGVLTPGNNGVGTMTVNGTLSLNNASRLEYEFGKSDIVGGSLNDLIEVGGDLMLDGVIDVAVSPGGNFDAGLYRVISYGGTLTDNSLDLGDTPPGSDVFVQTAVANQVNLVNVAGLDLNFWDGASGPKFDNAVNGGDGVWQASAADNWSDLTGALNADYQDGAFAIFSAAPGTVTVDESAGAVYASGMQFASDGYLVNGDAIGLTGTQAIFRVGDGTEAGQSMTATVASELVGDSDLIKTDLGTLILEGTNAYTGETIVDAGMLLVNGDNAGSTGQTMVNAAVLGGAGIIGGDVVVAGGAIAPGSSGAGTLTINGSLTLDTTSSLMMEFGEAGIVGGALNDLIEVGGDLVLDGTINISETAGGLFDVGIYRVFDYAGSLTDNGLEVGSLPSGSSVFVQTSVANQVNLINSNGLLLSFWDGDNGAKFNGTVDGGNGIWQNASGNDNWTGEDGALNAPYDDGTFAIFSGALGTVTVDASLGQVAASGMQFATDGYWIGGDKVLLTGPQSVLRVGDGTLASESMTATIAAELTGSTQLVKTDLGTLVLDGINTYTGGTAINGGVLQISGDTNLGEASGAMSFAGGALRTTANIASDRDVNFDGDGTIITEDNTVFNLNGRFSGAGYLEKRGGGTLILSGDNSAYAGRADVANGNLAINSVFAGSVDIHDGGRLEGSGSAGDVVNYSGASLAPGFDGIGQFSIASYSGVGGTLEIEAKLGGDASAADQLVVIGDTSGLTRVSVINLEGLGGQTHDGIKIIDVEGVSGGIFTLDGDYVFEGDQAVVAGAYAYRLQKNGRANPDDGDWYLRSAYLLEEESEAPTSPLYQPGVPLFEAYPQTLAALNEVPTLRERVGSRNWRNGVWGRVEGALHRARPEGSVTRTKHDSDIWRLEAGVDATLVESRDETMIGGIVANHAQSHSDVSSVYGAGDVETRAFGLGATLSWYRQDGVYWDLQGRANWYDAELQSHTAGWTLDNDAFGWAGSIEFGRRMDIGHGLSVTPQMQHAFSNVAFDAFADSFDAKVQQDQGDRFQSRFGIELDGGRTWSNKQGRENEVRAYAITNLHVELLDPVSIRVSETPFRSGADRYWGSFGIGGDYTWNNQVTIFGETLAETSLEDFGDSRRLTGRFGVRFAF
ncbi:autotransporter-associated beta strand repeat-containing protein [Hyphomonas sp.]|uniref:autotransporter-associated beta strand repeat-containing protein n=1 Tax=Hyphomonas sp. TaxID=87 RepID=UPI0032D95978